LEAQFPLLEKRIREIEHEIAAHKSPQVHAEVDLQKLDRQLEDIQAKYEKLMKQKVIIDAASVLLRDNGIKTRIIRHYLPIINRTINHYLNAMDFPVLFTLDEEFVEHLKSRYRDDFAYDSFSEGEKKRIDLALLLTWRAVAALKNSAATNLLILDEVFDSSLDVAGTDEFMKIIAGLEKETNVFVISHKTDQLIDKFSHVVTFEKSRGFSQIKV
jgi:DNA repair exonuclease SbcCD ATPase subunit